MSRESTFPWPSTGQIADAAQCIRDEAELRRRAKRQTWEDLGLPGESPEPEPMSAEDTVLIVLWSLRGDRAPAEAVE